MSVGLFYYYNNKVADVYDCSRRYPAICQQTNADPETGCMEVDIEKGRLSFRLTASYSEERWRAASKTAKATTSNLAKSMV